MNTMTTFTRHALLLRTFLLSALLWVGCSAQDEADAWDLASYSDPPHQPHVRSEFTTGCKPQQLRDQTPLSCYKSRRNL